MDLKQMNRLFKPQSIAVVGASNQVGKIGHTVVKNLLESQYDGKIYPINPKDAEVQGLKAYKSVLEVPEDIDSAVITVPASLVEQVVEECGKKGIGGLIIITSGFSEVGHRDLENRIVEIARRYGTRIQGPNIVGTMSNSNKMNASFGPSFRSREKQLLSPKAAPFCWQLMRPPIHAASALIS